MKQHTHPDLLRATELLKAGALVAFPTETVYGLGADATNDLAVAAIFKAKGRPSNNPLIVHTPCFASLCSCIDLSNHPDASRIRAHLDALQPLWPGPLSVVVPKAGHISPLVSAGGSTVALRIPAHPLALELLEACEIPLAAPSANPSMYISPTCADHVRQGLGDSVALILDGGPCAVGIESTVLSLVTDKPTILRPGAVTPEVLETTLGCAVITHSSASSAASSILASPGMLAKHYAPHTPVMLAHELTKDTHLPTRVGAIVFHQGSLLPFTPVLRLVLSERGELTEVAAHLFAALRELDSAGLDLIVVETCEPRGMGAAIMDRLVRASFRSSTTR